MKAAPEIISVKYNPDFSIDSRAKFNPKYMKNLNVHQYIRIKVIFRIDLYVNRCQKLNDLGFFWKSVLSKFFLLSLYLSLR